MCKQKSPQILKLSNCKITSLSSPQAFIAKYTNPNMSSLYHINIISSIPYPQSSPRPLTLNQSHHLCLLFRCSSSYHYTRHLYTQTTHCSPHSFSLQYHTQTPSIHYQTLQFLIHSTQLTYLTHLLKPLHYLLFILFPHPMHLSAYSYQPTSSPYILSCLQFVPCQHPCLYPCPPHISHHLYHILLQSVFYP